MGCGACGQSEAVVEPMPSLENKLRIILDEVQFTNVLTSEECKKINDLLAARKRIPEIDFTGDGPAGPTTLLNEMERVIWKCLVFGDHPIYQSGKFKPDIQPLNENQQTNFYQIKLDVNRTFPESKTLNRNSLQIVLRNIAGYFPGVGYTQGMNFIVGIFLECGFNMEETFWLFVTLACNPHFLLIRNFSSKFENITAFGKVFEDQLQTKHALLNHRLKQTNLEFVMFGLPWFMCWWSYTLSQESTVLIWDYMIKGAGIGGMLGIGYETMKMLQRDILESEGMENVLKLLQSQNLKKCLTPAEISKLIEKYSKLKNKITLKTIMAHDPELKKIINDPQKYKQFLAKTKAPQTQR